MKITKSSVCSDNVSNIHVYTTSYSYYLPTKRQTYFAHTEFVEYSKVRCSIKLFSLIFFINLYDYFIFISSSQFNEIHPLASRSSFMITQYWRQPLALRYKLSYACRVLLTHMKCICSLMNKYRYGRGVSNEWKQTKQNQTEQKKNWDWKYGNIMLSPAFDFRQFNLSEKCQPHHIRQYLSQSPKCRLRLKNSPENQILVCTHNTHTHPEPPLKDEAICDSRIRCWRFDEALVAECYLTRCAHA